MAKELHQKYPDCGRKKLKVFTVEVNEVFESIKEGEGDPGGEDDHDSYCEEVQVVEEVVRGDDDATRVKRGIGSTMSALYSSGGKRVEGASDFDHALDRINDANKKSGERPQ